MHVVFSRVQDVEEIRGRKI